MQKPGISLAITRLRRPHEQRKLLIPLAALAHSHGPQHQAPTTLAQM
jgi:hypothetical protein